MEIFTDAADTVAAHLGFATVGVEHAHFGVGIFGCIGRTNQDEAVGTNPEVPVGEGAGKDGEVAEDLGGVGKGVDVDVVVAQAMHFDKGQGGKRRRGRERGHGVKLSELTEAGRQGAITEGTESRRGTR